ncbi:hypothetical protein FNV43_RR21596 [Rhamnella rubrinervis]|uniref:SCP domain-containing protein n=1 Tax=Rhamnella rubrinervis TaxID=2594499 RepID=A0A8K0DPZ8_9ROSA|nr:hypothetical protein FNV43_RR21596 [Rhamnella rubrinervis]
MDISKISTTLIICMLGFLAQLQFSHGQNAMQDYLDAHNSARAAVGAGCLALVHSRGPYGENLAWSSSDLSGTAAVNMWVGEKAHYNYNSNSCASGQQCGHYTQVVWRNSVRVGCAKVLCNNGGAFIICNYDPPGNYNGQRPY